MARQSRRSARAGKGNFKKFWKETKELHEKDSGLGDYIEVDTGTYVMQLVDAKVGEFNGKLQLKTIWAVAGDDESRGKRATEFRSLEEPQQAVWVCRQLAALGAEVDDIEDPSDIETVFQDLIESGACARIKIVENDGYLNIRFQRGVEVDEDDLLSSSEVKRAVSGAAISTSDDEEEDEEDDEEDDERGSSVSKKDLNVGDTVVCVIDGDTVKGEITDVPSKGNRVQIRAEDAEDEEDVEGVNVSDIKEHTPKKKGRGKKKASPKKSSKKSKKAAKKKSAKAKKNDDDDEDGDDVSFEKGDEISTKHEGKTREGVVKEVDEDEELVTVKLTGIRKHVTKHFSKVKKLG